TRRCTSPRRTRGTAAAGHSYRCPRPPSAPRYARGKTPSAPGHGRTSSGTTCWGSAGLAPGRAEAARAARARRELLHDLQLHLRHRNHDELRDAIHRLHGENLLAAVPERDHERSLIVRVDEADQVPEHDAAFRSEAGAPMWIAMPEETSWLSPGLSVISFSMHARRSSPAEPALA